MREDGIVILSGIGALLPMVMTSHGLGCMRMIVDLPPEPPMPDLQECILQFTCRPEPQLDTFMPRESAWQRRNCNAPWYRQFNRRRR